MDFVSTTYVPIMLYVFVIFKHYNGFRRKYFSRGSSELQTPRERVVARCKSYTRTYTIISKCILL